MVETHGDRRVAMGLYWRKSLWNGARCVPVIVTLESGLFAMSGADGEVFSVPVAKVRAKRGKLGTLTVSWPGAKFHLVGRGGAISPAFTDAQRQQLQDLGASQPPVVNSPADWDSMIAKTREWFEQLLAAGAQDS